LKGKGLKAKSGTGDLLASVRIVLPEQVDDEFKELMKKWRDNKPYDPRGGLE
jgi:DnaJ-class molecular chaperone